MKRILFALLALLAVTLCACSSEPSGTAIATTSPTTAATATVATMNTAEMEKKIIDLEKKSWDLYKNKKFEEGAKMNAPGYQSIYFGKVKSDAEATDDTKYIEIKDISFSDWKATFPTKDVAIATYKFKISSKYKNLDKSGDYVGSTVWVNINGDWKQSLYHETRVEPQP